MVGLLDRSYHQTRTPEQEARNREGLQRLLANDLRPGELVKVVLGKNDITQEVEADQVLNPTAERMRRTVSQNLCLDCNQDVRHDGQEPLVTQPRRCRPCGSDKRRAENTAHRTKRKQEREQAERLQKQFAREEAEYEQESEAIEAVAREVRSPWMNFGSPGFQPQPVQPSPSAFPEPPVVVTSVRPDADENPFARLLREQQQEQETSQ